MHIFKSKENFVPRIFSPNKFNFFKALIEAFNDSIDLDKTA